MKFWKSGLPKIAIPKVLYALVIAALFQQQKRRLYTWTSPLKSDWSYSLQPKMETLYTVSKNKTGRWLWLRSWTPVDKFRLKLKKVRKTSRPFRYDLNQIPYNYTVEVTNRFKGLDLIELLKNDGHRFVTLYRRQWSRPSSRKRNAIRQNGCLRRPDK